jgi:hypothetical protein
MLDKTRQGVDDGVLDSQGLSKSLWDPNGTGVLVTL